MRLDSAEAGACFVRICGNAWETLPSADGAQGIHFKCPLATCGHLVLAWFRNPLNAPMAPPEHEPLPRWTRAGTTLADLSLTPSIALGSGCRWHGYVTDGVAT